STWTTAPPGCGSTTTWSRTPTPGCTSSPGTATRPTTTCTSTSTRPGTTVSTPWTVSPGCRSRTPGWCTADSTPSWTCARVRSTPPPRRSCRPGTITTPVASTSTPTA